MTNKDNGGPAFPCEYEGSTRIDADTARRYMQGITRAKLKYSEEDLPDEYK